MSNNYNVENTPAKTKYAMEHLVTLRVQDCVNSVELNEKLQSLVDLFDRNEILPLKINMSFDHEQVLIYDENHVQVDNFPGAQICEPRAFTDAASPLKEYNNLLVFCIAEASRQSYEMHFFQVN